MPLKNEGGRLVLNHASRVPPLSPAFFEAELQDEAAGAVLVHPVPLGMEATKGLVQGNPIAILFRHSLLVDSPQVHNDRIPDLRDRLLWTLAFFEGQAAGMPGQTGPTPNRKEALSRLRGAVPGRVLWILSARSLQAANRILAATGATLAAEEGGIMLWRLLPAP